MRSVPVAITWEMLTRGRWNLLAFALAANLMPMFLLSALRHEGAIEPSDTSLLIMHVVLIQLNMFIFGAALFDAAGQPARLFALPVSTASLVAWQMLPAMAVMVLQSVTSTALMNAAFDVGWPLWGPALFAAVGVAAMQAVLWTTEKSGWILLALTVVGLVLGLWFKSRFGPLFSQPTHLWLEVAPLEVLTLLMFAGLSYYAAVVGVARRRCGESLPSLGIIAWVERVFDPPPDVGPPFVAPLQAQYWMEWRKKGWALPVIVVFGMFIGLSIWVIFIRKLPHLFEGFAAGGAMVTMMGFIGMFLGNVGSNDTTFEMGHFLATRPLTNTEISRTILKVLARSVLMAWTIWAVPFAILYATLCWNQAVPHTSDNFVTNWGWRYFPATLLGCWTITTVLASLAMTGRSTLLAKTFFGVVAFLIGEMLFSKFALPADARLSFDRGVFVTIGVLLGLGTIWLFFAARRRGLIGTSTVSIAACVWTLLSGLIVLDWSLHPARPQLLGVLAFSAAALVVAPLAAAPLAMAWNRNR